MHRAPRKAGSWSQRPEPASTSPEWNAPAGRTKVTTDIT
jgi:hypothetical protein